MTILLCNEIKLETLCALLNRYNLNLEIVNKNKDIPGSFWKESEAGLIGNTLYIRSDTPVHSALHEACHYICMDQQRRENLHTDAGGTVLEESGVCYLQILLADFIPEMKRERMLSDMDEWGYSYRLGSAKAWFEQDAEDAFEWLLKHKLVSTDKQPGWVVRK